MQQHPIPQNVTQYQFRLVGDMTLKQFLELASGLILAYLFFSSNLIFLFKWPLVLFSIFFGVALAFFPLEERPLDIWIINFLHAIYNPTRFIWQKTNKVPAIFTFIAHPIVETVTAVKTLKAPMLGHTAAATNDLSPTEEKQIQALESLLSKPAPASASPGPKAEEIVTKPSVVVRKLKPAEAVAKVTTVFQQSPTSPTPAKVGQPSTINTNPRPHPATTTVFEAPSIHATAPKTNDTPLTNISLPSPPTSPNLITGIVVDQTGRLVEGAIVQVVDGSGIPARAMKTNALGQFFTTTPLASATYTIEIEKDGLRFPGQQLVTKGELIAPILLRATA